MGLSVNGIGETELSEGGGNVEEKGSCLSLSSRKKLAGTQLTTGDVARAESLLVASEG